MDATPNVVRAGGLEPPCPKTMEPKSIAYTKIPPRPRRADPTAQRINKSVGSAA